MFTAVDEGRKRLGQEAQVSTEHSNFDVGRDMDSRYLAVFREAGFSQVKRWYQAQNHIYRTGADFLSAPLNSNLRNLDQGLQGAVTAAYDDLSGANTPDLRVFETMVVLAFKD